MILVTGATGHLGSATIDFLLKKIPAARIAGLARDEKKASGLKEKGIDVRLGSYDDPASLDKAMQGVEKVLLVSGGDAGNALEQHQHVVDAAKGAGVKCIAYTSRALKDRSTLANQLMKRHFDTEDRIKESGLNYIFFRNILYMDTLPLFAGEKVFDNGIRLPAGQGKVAFALRSEMGEGIANVLTSGNCDNKIYSFTGSSAYSFYDVAHVLTELSGKKVNYTPVEQTVFEAQMKERGVPGAVIERTAGFMTDIKNGQEEEVSADLEQILGRRPTSLKEGLKILFRL